SVLVDEGVAEDDELARDGDQGCLCGFAGGTQASVEGAHVGIETNGREGGEIKDAPHARSSTEDNSRALAFARLIGDRSHAGEHAALFGGDAAELGQTGDQSSRGDEAEAWDRGQDVIATGETLIGPDAGEDRRIERFDILVCAFDAAIQLALEELDGGR